MPILKPLKEGEIHGNVVRGDAYWGSVGEESPGEAAIYERLATEDGHLASELRALYEELAAGGRAPSS